MSPFQALYGQEPTHVMCIEHQHTHVDTLDQLLQERDAMLDELQFNMAKAQQRIKHYADKKRRAID